MRYETTTLDFPTRQDPHAGNDSGTGSDSSAAAAGDGGQAGGSAGDQSADGGQTLLGGDGQSQPYTVPEKFMVKGADEQPDYKAIVEKLGQSYTHLEKRLGTGDVPPKTADEYKLEKYLPDGMEPNQEAMKPVLGEFHKLGLTQGQVQGVMSLFGQQLASGLATEKASFEAGQAALKTAWADEYPQKLADAKKALAVYSAEDPELKKLVEDPKLSNNPTIVRLLALVGAELNEDRPANNIDGAAAESIDEIRKSKAYLDPKDIGHADAVRKVTEAYTKGYKANRS